MDYTMYDICGLVDVGYQSGATKIKIKCLNPSCTMKHVTVNLRDGVFNCFKCGAHGGMLDFYGYAKYGGSKWPDKSLHSELNKEIKKELGLIADDGDVEAQRRRIREHKRRVQEQQRKADEEAAKVCKIADLEERHAVYSALFKNLKLCEHHRKMLRARGFTDIEIDAFGYKSLPQSGSQVIVDKILLEGLSLKGIPGFYKGDDGRWQMVKLPSGILIPVKSWSGKIKGCQIRFDKSTGDMPRYIWLSSNDKEQGTKATCFAHAVGNWKGEETVVITEGPLKADIFYLLTGTPVIAVPGVHSIENAIELLESMKSYGLKRVVTALDMDYLDDKGAGKNNSVFEAYEKLNGKLQDIGLTYKRLTWDRQYKGIDDYLMFAARGIT